MIRRRRSWVVVRTKGKFERITAANVEHKLGLESYYPRWRNLRTGKVEPLFPSYIFVQIINSQFSQLFKVRGFMGVLMNGGKPSYLDQEIIKQMKDMEMDGLVDLTNPFTVGQRLTIVGDGPFREAIYVGMKSKDRVKVLFELLGRQVSTEIDIKRVRA